MSTPTSTGDLRPWAAKRPQNFVLSAILIALAVGLVWQALTFIGEDDGGVVPYFMLVLGPALAIFYTWYFTIHDFGNAEDAEPHGSAPHA